MDKNSVSSDTVKYEEETTPPSGAQKQGDPKTQNYRGDKRHEIGDSTNGGNAADTGADRGDTDTTEKWGDGKDMRRM